MEKVACIACGSTEPDTAWGSKSEYMLRRCVSCGLVSVEPLPESTHEVYGHDYFSGATHGFGYIDYDADKEPMRRHFERYLADIEALLSQKGKLLDVGAATGFFVALAKERGWDAEGIEISDHAAALGRSRGLTIQTGMLSDVTSAPGSYAAITMLDVIEHVRDPRADLTRVAELLAPGGVVVLITPDVGSVPAKLLGTRWHLVVPPEHLYYFTRKSLCILLNSLGFEVVSVTRPGKSFTLRYFFATVARWCSIFPLPSLACFLARHPRWGDIRIPLNTYDNLLVVARNKVR